MREALVPRSSQAYSVNNYRTQKSHNYKDRQRLLCKNLTGALLETIVERLFKKMESQKDSQ